MLGLRELLEKTWEVFKKNWKVLVLIMLVPSGVGLAIGMVTAMVGGVMAVWGMAAGVSWQALVVGGVVILGLVIVAAYVSMWGTVALVWAVREFVESRQAGVKQSFAVTRPLIWKYMATAVWAGVAIAGGFVWLIVPGILFSVWFFAAQFIVIEEGIGGTAAMMKSKAYVKGRFWEVLRMLIGFVILVGLVAFLSGMISIVPFVGWIVSVALSMALGAMSIIFLFLLYQELKKHSLQEVQSQNLKGGWMYVLVGLAGVFVPMVLISLVIALVDPAAKVREATERIEEQKQYQNQYQEELRMVEDELLEQ